MVTATVVLAATLAGLSVSTTQVLVGSITGVALIPEDATSSSSSSSSASSSSSSSASSSAAPASSSEAGLSAASSTEAAAATTGKGDAAGGKGGLNGALIKKIALSWLITMPASALSAIAVYSLLL
jgi:phosphate/sulfate permease